LVTLEVAVPSVTGVGGAQRHQPPAGAADAPVPGEVLTAQAQQAEAAGLAGIFVPEIYSSPFMGLGYCAAVTERVQLASGIVNAFASSPFEIAMTAMDLDRVSGGRLVLGLGTSIKAWSEGFYGMPGYGKPVATSGRRSTSSGW
jgi:alkanesulfonate monooxygenase SsuD/methylene tetrahydromethanopterin reductase-like flavin-dependent oxidoreductase (luciferase family)